MKYNKKFWNEIRKCLGLLVTPHDTFEWEKDSCDRQAHQTWWKWCKDTKDTQCWTFVSCVTKVHPCPAQIQQIRDIMILRKQNLYSCKLISVNAHYYTLLWSKCKILHPPAHMTRWCTVSLSIWLCMNCGITFVSVVKTRCSCTE